MGTDIGNLSMVQHDDLVGSSQGRQSGWQDQDDAGWISGFEQSAGRFSFDSRLARRGFFGDDDARFFQKSSSDPQAEHQIGRQALFVGANERLESVGKFKNRIADPSQSGDFAHVDGRIALETEPQIVFDGTGHQGTIRGDPERMLPNRRTGQVFRVSIIEHQSSADWLSKSEGHFDERFGQKGIGRDDRGKLPGFKERRDIL